MTPRPPERRVVFHLHCYQPPREDPWTGAVPPEPSAAPAHDWNHRVTDECYRPLRAARLLDAEGFVLDARNLYADTSVDVGPTLHRWIAVHARDVDDAIRAGDRAAQADHAGHGAATAQPYVHAILPLASARDRHTLVRWGIADFRRRFGRDPEGMWLPEAAVDVDTLECLAANGIAFTILGQHQAARVRVGDDWVPATGALDPARPYLARLPSGATITVCFYDGALSHAIAFDRGLLDDGGRLAAAVAARATTAPAPALVVVATDGETFGHHHRFGEMALARALHDLAAIPGVAVGGLGAHLAAHPPTDEVEVVSPSAWSCAHGVERWRADCGDVTGGEPHWNQRWRAPLRAALDLLADRVASGYEAAAGALVLDPWALRDAYGTVIDASLAEREAFVRAQAADPDLAPAQVTRLLGLLELQRHVLLAFSSCAWFFADCAGIETTLSLRHAARALELARALLDLDLDREVARALAPMQANDPAAGDGRHLWHAATSSAVTTAVLAAWWAALTLVGVPGTRIGRITVAPRDRVDAGDDTARAVAARVTVTDEATGATAEHSVTALTWDARLVVVVDGPDHLRTVDALADLLRDPASGGRTLERTPAGRRLGLTDLPLAARSTVTGVWWRRLERAGEVPPVARVRALLDTTAAADVTVDPDRVDAVLTRVAAAVIRHATRAPVGGLRDLAFVVDVLGNRLPFRLRWTAQNAVLDARRHTRPAMVARAPTDVRARRWLHEFDRTAAALGVRPDAG